MFSITRRRLAGLATTAVLALGVSSAPAATTGIGPSFVASEPTHLDIFNTLYGGGFTANGDNFENGVITATRVDDFGVGGVLNVLSGSAGDADDQVWSSDPLTVFSAKAVGRFAAFNQSFGVFEGESGGAFQELFSVSGSGYAVTGEVSNVNLTGDFRFGRSGQNGPQSSLDGDNVDGLNHLVTYEITGLNGDKTWLLFWEDLNQGDPTDFDFNDLVVEVTATVIPLPTAIIPALGTLAGAFVIRRFRRSRRA